MADVAKTKVPEADAAGMRVSVRELCAFGAKTGDLDLRFTPSPTAQQGIAGHGKVAGRRAAGYEREVRLEGRFEDLLVRGRADGWDPRRQRLEEIKTHRGDSERIPGNHRLLHWAQLKVYGALLCRERGLDRIDLALVYFEITDERETVLIETLTAAELDAFFEALASRYIGWARQEQAHRKARNESLIDLRFPHGDFNAGQRELAAAVFRAAIRRRTVLAQAPTGIGKTAGTLFPALKACTREPIDKIYFLTAKSTGRWVALQALAGLGSTRPLRVLELRAKAKSCVHPDRACHGASCPLAKGFYDRLPAARAAAVASPSPLGHEPLAIVAAEHEVCPYYLAQELIRWSDVIVGDYNYYFDTHAILHDMAVANDWRVTVLVDEAHNLVDRARDMYSASLDARQLRRARKVAPPACKRSLDVLHRRWQALEAAGPPGYRILSVLPPDMLAAVSDFVTRAGEALGETQFEYQGESPGPPPGRSLGRSLGRSSGRSLGGFEPELQQFFFDAVSFQRLVETYDERSMADLLPNPADPRGRETGTTICIRNIVPAGFLAPRINAAHGTALFSATLTPPAYYRDMLGLGADWRWFDVPSPFESRQLAVRIARNVSTRYLDRDASLDAIVACIAAQYRAAPGNYLAFFSSHDYLERAFDRLAQRHPDLPLWRQARQMDEAARQAFIARFTAAGRGIGFAVLGGSFSEGVDLPGARLIGAFVVTLGIPQVNPVNEEFRRRLDALFGCGYDYTYLYPGLRKVVQAAGRVIRTRQDRGTVFLIDDRYGRPEIRRLLPAWWNLDMPDPVDSIAAPLPKLPEMDGITGIT